MALRRYWNSQSEVRWCKSSRLLQRVAFFVIFIIPQYRKGDFITNANNFIQTVFFWLYVLNSPDMRLSCQYATNLPLFQTFSIHLTCAYHVDNSLNMSPLTFYFHPTFHCWQFIKPFSILSILLSPDVYLSCQQFVKPVSFSNILLSPDMHLPCW